MSMFQRATRQQVPLKLGITGPSGSGKTTAALRLARGLIGPGCPLALVDTENGSASLYADETEFDVVNMNPPYTVAKFTAAIADATSAGYKALIIDSASAEWTELLTEKEAKDARGGNGFVNWGAITKKHEDFLKAVRNASIHLVLCLRAKQEHVQDKDDKGKTTIRKVGMAAVQRDGMEYELTTVFDIAMDHNYKVSKDRTRLFDGRMEMINVATGQELAAWLSSGAPLAENTGEPLTPATAQAPANPTPDLVGHVRGTTREQDMTRPKASPATTGPSKQNSAAVPAQTAPSKPQATAAQYALALADLNSAMFAAGWGNDAKMATAEEWKAKGPAAMPELLALLKTGLPAQPPTDNPEWIAAMDELLQVSMGMPAATRKALVAGFEAEGLAGLPGLLAEIQKIRTADAAPKTVGAVLAQLPRTAGPEVDQASATFVDSVQPDTDEANGGISADEYEILNTILKAHGINRDAMRAYAAGSHKLLPGAGGRPTLARFKKAEFDKLLVRLRDTKIAADGETWSQRTIRIINATPTTTYQPVPAAS